MLCIRELTHSHFGGFLLHRGWFRPSLAIQTTALLSTGGNAVSRAKIFIAPTTIGVVFVTTAYALEMRLRWPILGCYPIAVGTLPARVVRRHRDFSTLKTERTNRNQYPTRDAARADIVDYIERFYNPLRRHSTLVYLSPVNYEKLAASG